jgi:cyclophilin family peptidyl-prolyl cis-trans isomerase
LIPSPTRRPLLALTGLAVAFVVGACTAGGGATPGETSGPPASVVAPASQAAAGECPTAQPDALPAGESRVVTIETSLGSIAITLEADLSPIAVGNFVALAGCGYYDGVVFHRVVPGFVIQGGDGQNGKKATLDPDLVGTGGPGYEIQDEPVTAVYARATVAMARTSAPNSVGSQFFIVLDDAARASLESANTYQIIGTVTSGMETADAIAAAADAEIPSDPIEMTDVSVTQP